MFMHAFKPSLRQLQTYLIQGICQNLQTMIDIIPVRKFALILSKNKLSVKNKSLKFTSIVWKILKHTLHKAIKTFAFNMTPALVS